MSNRFLLGLWLIKIFAGVFLGWLSGNYYTFSDYDAANYWGWQEHMLLINEPATFFTDIFHSHYPNGYSGFFSGTKSYWNDLSNNIIFKFLGGINIFTRGNYYLNSLFFNAVAFIGPVALYRVYKDIYPGTKWLVIAGCFLIPSTLYFTSGIHKDAIVFAALCVLCYAVYFSLKNGLTVRRILLAFTAAFVLLLIRNFVLLALLPALAAWVIAHYNKKIVATFTVTYLITALLVVAHVFVSPNKNPLSIVSEHQKNYRQLPVANTQLKADSLPPTIKGFAIHAPTAIEHGFMRPFVWDFPGTPSPLVAIELLAFQLLFLAAVAFSLYNKSHEPFIYFGICITITLLIFIGYVVPNAGSIARYRSLYLPFVAIPLLYSAREIYIRFKNI